jgi:hypothetical protein
VLRVRVEKKRDEWGGIGGGKDEREGNAPIKG